MSVVGKKQVIAGYIFERISDTEYAVTAPNGATQVKYYTAAENLMTQLQRKENDNAVKSEVYETTQQEYHKLKAFAEALNAYQDKLFLDVQTCVKDYGAGIMWTTIIAKRVDGMTYMFLNPAQQKQLLEASYTDFAKLVSTTLSKLRKGKNYGR